MNVDFYEQYKAYSTAELLKIVRVPEAYQPAAVAAAERLLGERQVTAADTEEAEAYFRQADEEKALRAARINAYKARATGLLRPALDPTAPAGPAQWLGVLLVAAGIKCAWKFYTSVKELIQFLACDECGFDFSVALIFFDIVYLPALFYLLYKRKRLGWTILFAENAILLISMLGQSYIFFKYQELHQGDTSSFLFSIVIKAAFVAFLWRGEIAACFGVTARYKRRTVWVAAIVALIFVAVLQFL